MPCRSGPGSLRWTGPGTGHLHRQRHARELRPLPHHRRGPSWVTAYNASADLRWPFSFLSTDKKRTYCPYEAADGEALIKRAQDLGIALDAMVEVSEVNPQMFTTGASVSGHNGV